VRRLLQMIGFDPLGTPFDLPQPLDVPAGTDPLAERRLREEALELYWLGHPEGMDAAPRAGPRSIRTQRGMVTVDDYGLRLQAHPLIHRAHSWLEWTGAWTAVRVAVIGWNERSLDDALSVAVLPLEMRTVVDAFHRAQGLPLPPWDSTPTL